MSSRLLLVLGRLLVLVIRSVSPLAIANIAYLLLIYASHPLSLHALFATRFIFFRFFPCPNSAFCLAFNSWCLLEVLFLPLYLYFVNKIQKRHPENHFASNFHERQSLFRNCIKAAIAANPSSFHDPLKTIAHNRNVVKSLFMRWFLSVSDFSQLKNHNFEMFFAWAYFDKDFIELSNDELSQLRSIVSEFCVAIGIDALPEGYNENIKCIRLRLDKTMTTHRPLIYYIVTHTAHGITHLSLIRLGFVRRKVVVASGIPQYVYERIPKCRNSQANPILFIHGIGIGLATYLTFISKFPTNVPIYLLDWPHISMNILVESIPEISDTLELFKTLLYDPKEKVYSPATFVAHSLGTVAISWLLHPPPSVFIPPNLIASIMLIDPVSLLLFDPKVATNFLHKPPDCLLEFLMEYFVARELSIANALSRHFHWSWNNLFVEELASVGLKMKSIDAPKVIIALAELDHISPTSGIKDYVEHYNQRRNPETDGRIDLIWVPGFGHGQMIFLDSTCELLAEKTFQIAGEPLHLSTSFEERISLLNSVLNCTYMANPQPLPSKSLAIANQFATHAAKLLSKEMEHAHRIRVTRDMFSKWFCGASLDTVWMKNWDVFNAFVWFDKEFKDLDSDELLQLHKIMEIIIQELELDPIKPGFNDKVKCLRPQLEPVMMIHRPLLYYLVRVFNFSLFKF
ncbi:hypothetical protein HK096_001747 [Nowakowskiella sp. JEL0078]|nr:hypothetical protein HK096_001747 [Nowakowskiella sp. JEL0078]